MRWQRHVHMGGGGGSTPSLVSVGLVGGGAALPTPLLPCPRSPCPLRPPLALSSRVLPEQGQLTPADVQGNSFSTAEVFFCRSALLSQVLPELERVTPADVQAFLPSMLAALHLETLLHGNLTAAEAEGLAKEVCAAPTRLPGCPDTPQIALCCTAQPARLPRAHYQCSVCRLMQRASPPVPPPPPPLPTAQVHVTLGGGQAAAESRPTERCVQLPKGCNMLHRWVGGVGGQGDGWVGGQGGGWVGGQGDGWVGGQGGGWVAGQGDGLVGRAVGGWPGKGTGGWVWGRLARRPDARAAGQRFRSSILILPCHATPGGLASRPPLPSTPRIYTLLLCLGASVINPRGSTTTLLSCPLPPPPPPGICQGPCEEPRGGEQRGGGLLPGGAAVSGGGSFFLCVVGRHPIRGSGSFGASPRGRGRATAR